MKIFFKNLMMLMLLLLGSCLLTSLGSGIWNGTRGVSRVNQVPIWCKASVVLAGIIWFTVCIVFGKPIAQYLNQIITKACILFRCMPIRNKLIFSAICLSPFPVIFWLFWSPLAPVSKGISFLDLVQIHWAVRTQTFWPILRIDNYINYRPDDASVDVIAGAKRPWVDGTGYYYYQLRKTEKGWEALGTGCPVQWKNGAN